jgi:hypothetical protein
MVDLAAVIGRVRGMIFSPDATLAEHTTPMPPWRVVAREHTLPLLVGSAVSAYAFQWIWLTVTTAGTGLNVGLALLVIVVNVAMNFAQIALLAGIVKIFAGMFGGRQDFDSSYALVSLALTPLYVALAVMPLVGALILFAGLIYALVILYRNTPMVLRVPPENRAKHFALTLVTMFLVSIVVTLVFLGLVSPPQADGVDLGPVW